MPTVTTTLKKALTQLRTQRATLDRQIAAVEAALAGFGGRGGAPGRKTARAATRARRTMTAAQKRAVSRRMKAYWKSRKAASSAK